MDSKPTEPTEQPQQEPAQAPANRSEDVTADQDLNQPDVSSTVESVETHSDPAPPEAVSTVPAPEIYRTIPERRWHLDVTEFHRQLNHRLSQWRPSAWENDLSINNMDADPFENLPSPPELSRDQFDPLMYKAVARFAGVDSLDEFIQRDPYPIPCADDREGYSPGFPGTYWLSGFREYLKICNMAKDHGTTINSYLDLGCASGRIVRHFCAQSEVPEIWAADINGRHVRWLTEFLPQNVKPISGYSLPALPIPDASVDVISAFSVFTHIDTFEAGWLAELSRILKPDGFCYITIQNDDTWKILREHIDNPNNRLIKSMTDVDPETPEKLMQPMPNTRVVYRFTDFGPYRAQVFHSNEYLEKVWGRYFTVGEIKPREHAFQTVVVLTKK